MCCFEVVRMDGEIKPVYVLEGSEPYLLDSHRRRIVADAIGQADPQVCVVSFDASAELFEVLDELRTLPFLAPRRVVIVSDADAFVTAHRESLERYLKAPASSGVLVLMVSSFPSSTRLHKLVGKIGQVIVCSISGPKDLMGRIIAAAETQGKQITRDAIELLLTCVGENLTALNVELEKLSTYVGERKRIGTEDVSAVVTGSAPPGAFALTNAITSADIPAALRALEKMLVTRGHGFKTLGMIGWHLRRAIGAKQNLERGATPREALPHMPRQQINAFKNMLARRTIESFHLDFRRMIQADLEMKSGAEQKGTLQTLVIGLCR